MKETIEHIKDMCERYGFEMDLNKSISFSCQKCNGEIVYEIKVKENTDLNIFGNAKINLGALTITVKDELEEEQYYQDIIVDDFDFQITLPESKKYHISIIHDDFKGSYKLNWNK